MRTFGRLSVLSFGGPVAHIALMHEEVVARRRWIDEQRFLDLIGLTNLIPGPNSTELAMHIGHDRAGWKGLLTAGGAFILPASLIVLAVAWVYRRFGQTPVGGWILEGVKPVVVMIVAQALLKLLPVAVKGWLTALAGVAATAAYLVGVNEILILFVIAALVMAISSGNGFVLLGPVAGSVLDPNTATGPFDLDRLAFVFLKVGALLYGSGYVLAAFLHNDLVERWGVLTNGQLLDAIAIGQTTPGPVFTTATFIGYYLFGLEGAAVATLAIFLPSFLLVAAVARWGSTVRRYPQTGAFLDGVNVASLGLMAGVTLQLAVEAIADPLSISLAVVAAGLLLLKVNSVLVIVVGILAGLAGGWLGAWS
ncbi:MAG TPA: chromate efflux transporter [Acidimicrobiia bacterium]|nr:chromate efflux transporter [Acidimicrobiia bacterium]